MMTYLRQIDIMMLYTDLALVQLGGVTTAQMESTITEGLVTSNTAFENSEVPIEFSLVHVGQVKHIWCGYGSLFERPATRVNGI